jgi:hypothetical protein
MKLPKIGSFVEVRLIDMSFHNKGWPGTLKFRPARIRARGWLVRVRPRFIVLAANESSDRGYIDYGMLTLIVRGQMLKVRRLR